MGCEDITYQNLVENCRKIWLCIRNKDSETHTNAQIVLLTVPEYKCSRFLLNIVFTDHIRGRVNHIILCCITRVSYIYFHGRGYKQQKQQQSQSEIRPFCPLVPEENLPGKWHTFQRADIFPINQPYGIKALKKTEKNDHKWRPSLILS